MVRTPDNTGGAYPLVPPSGSPAARADSIISAAMAPSAPETATVSGDTRSTLPETITIKPGDTIHQLAAKYQVSVDQIKALNPALFQSGADAAGKKRAVDGRLVYPGDVLRLRAAEVRPIDPAKTTVVSDKVVTAAKDYLDQATIVPPETAGGRGREVSQKVIDSSQKMLTLIPGRDPERPTYENKVAKLISDFLAQYPDQAQGAPQKFKVAGKGFNTAVKAYQDASKVAGQLPAEDIKAFQADAMQRALDAYTDAALAVGAMAEGPDKKVAAEQLSIMAYALSQIQIPAEAIAAAQTHYTTLPTSVQTGGGEAGTQQPIGQLPGSPAQPGVSANQVPAAPASTPYSPAVQPMPGYSGPPVQPMPPTQPTAAQGQVGPDGTVTYTAAGGGTYTQRPGEIAVYTAKTIESYTSQPTQASNEPPANKNGTNGSNGTNGTNGTNGPNGPNQTDSGRKKKDPNDPNVKKLWDFLKHADHKAVRDLIANNFDMFYASLPEQKALMIKILVDGRTSGEDQAAIAQIADMSRQQGESDDMVKELNRLYGGDPKGVMRMLEDCKRGPRDQVLQALFGDPPDGVQYSPAFYASLTAAMDKRDVKDLCNGLGLTPGSKWLDRLPPQAKQAMAGKLDSWFSWLPFNSDKGLKSALVNSMSSGAVAPSRSPRGN